MTKKSAKKSAAPKAKKRTVSEAAANLKAAKAAKKAKAPKAAKAAKPAGAGKKARYDWKGAEAGAAEGKVPAFPDFSAPTHAPFKATIEALDAAAKAKDVAALKAIEINPTSSTPKALDRYRNIVVKALSAK